VCIVADVCITTDVCDVCIRKLNWNLEIRMDDKDVHIPFCENEIEENDTEKHFEIVEIDKRRTKANTYGCWRYFSRLGVDKDGKERAKCNGCNKIFMCGRRKYGTSHLKRHVMKCDKMKSENIG